MYLKDREVLWIWDEFGGVGKSELANYLYAVYDCFVLDPKGSSKDIWYSYNQRRERGKHIAVMDIPMAYFGDIDYGILE